MRSPVKWLVTAVVLAGCGADRTGVNDGAGGAPAAVVGGGGLPAAGASGSATAGASGSAMTAGASGSAMTAGGLGGEAAVSCPEVREPLRAAGTQIELTFAPRLAGKPLVLGEPNAMAGGSVTPTNIRFYVSELSLLAADGTSKPVDLVSSTGKPVPFGIQLVNLEEPESLRLHVLAPAGSYSGARFTFGINDACNGGGANRNPPLSASSQMGWPHLAGFLFFRYEAQWIADAAATASMPPPMVHMGGLIGQVFAPQATVAGALVVPQTGTLGRTIQVSFDAVFQGASSSGDTSQLFIQTAEVIAGEHLRRAVPTLPIFKLAEP